MTEEVSLSPFFLVGGTHFVECTLFEEHPFGEAHFCCPQERETKSEGETCMLTTAEEIGAR